MTYSSFKSSWSIQATLLQKKQRRSIPHRHMKSAWRERPTFSMSTARTLLQICSQNNTSTSSRVHKTQGIPDHCHPQMQSTMKRNTTKSNSGLYLNHLLVCLHKHWATEKMPCKRTSSISSTRIMQRREYSKTRTRNYTRFLTIGSHTTSGWSRTTSRATISLRRKLRRLCQGSRL